MTLHEPQLETAVQTCVLLAPAGVDVGKNVTDAVTQGGWRLLCIGEAVNAMATLCKLEATRREIDRTQPTHNMLLIHRDIHIDVNGALQAAVRKHLPGVKVHEIQGASASAQASENAPRATSHVQAANDDSDSPVVGRIGHAANGATMGSHVARRALQVAEEIGDEPADDADRTDDTAESHEVSRDEISMLLEDDERSEEHR